MVRRQRYGCLLACGSDSAAFGEVGLGCRRGDTCVAARRVGLVEACWESVPCCAVCMSAECKIVCKPAPADTLTSVVRCFLAPEAGSPWLRRLGFSLLPTVRKAACWSLLANLAGASGAEAAHHQGGPVFASLSRQKPPAS